MRKGCRASKNEKKCEYYDYGLGRCKRGLVRGTCSKLKPGKNAKEVKMFYDSSF